MTADLYAAVWDEADLLTVPADADETTPDGDRPVDLTDDGYEVSS